MQVQVHTDKHIEGTQERSEWINKALQAALQRFSSHITRVEVHLSDENGGKQTLPENKQCTLEARLEGHQPQVVKHQATSLHLAVEGAADKLVRVIEHTLGRVTHS